MVTIDRGIVDDLDPVQRDEMFLRLAIAISRSGRLTKVGDIVDQYGDRSYGPFERVPVAVDVNPELLVFLGERQDQFPGVNVVQRTVRSYPYGTTAAHLLGYVGPITRTEWQARNQLIDPGDPDAKTYQLNHEIGKTGVELIFEDELRGVPGTRFIEVDASRKVVREYDYVPPVPGNDVWLSIDLDLQALAEQELTTGLAAARSRTRRRGSAERRSSRQRCRHRPRNGDLLAMASFPTYEPADFVNGITATQFSELTSEDNFSPILNRAIQGTYAPGSTFKLVTALAALQEGVLGDEGLRRPTDLYLDTGSYTYSNCFQESSTCLFSSPTPAGAVRSISRLRCGSRATPTSTRSLARVSGPVRARPTRTVFVPTRESSCGRASSVWAAIRVCRSRTSVPGPSPIVTITTVSSMPACLLSMGASGSPVPPSTSRSVRVSCWSRRCNWRTPMRPSATAVRFISRMWLCESPILTGRWCGSSGPAQLRDLEIPEEFQAPIEEGLLGATMDTGGTATRAFGQADFNVWNWPVAGKTGTAEVDLKADTSLFAAYGPVYRPGSAVGLDTVPEVALSVVLEESGFGSASAAPVAAAIFEHLATDTVPVARSLNETARYALGLIDDDGQTTTSVGANG